MRSKGINRTKGPTKMAATNHGQFYFKLYVALIKENTQTEQNE